MFASRSSDTRLADLTRALEASAPLAPDIFAERTLSFAATALEGSAQDVSVAPVEPNPQAVKAALQLAIELELSTLPPYLCAMWSIIEPPPPENQVYGLIHNIVLNEMAHLGNACNMLAALGGTPGIRNVFYEKLSYPTTGLPGGVLLGLTVDLGSLSHDRVVKIFQVIETPEDEIGASLLEGANEYTIGRFYDALLAAALQLPDGAWHSDHQLDDAEGGSLVSAITSRDGVKKAIDTIKLQGEGSAAGPYWQDGMLAHYYAFEQIARQNKIVGVSGTPPVLQWSTDAGDAKHFSMPPHYEMIPITENNGGRYANPPANIVPLLAKFNAAWDGLLTALDHAWASGSSSELVGAEFGAMRALSRAALELFSTPPDGIDRASNVRYGPEFVKPA